MISLSTSWHTLRLIRPHNCLIASASVAVGAFLASHRLEFESVMGLLMAFFVCAGGYALNDIFDIRSDRIAKPWRPVAAGTVTREGATGCVVITWAVAAAFGLLAGWAAAVFFLAWAVLLYLYSWKLKPSGLPGHLVISAVGSSGFVLGAVVGGNPSAAAFPFAIAMFLHMARETVKSVVDTDADRKAGTATLAVRLGERKTLAISLWTIGGIVAASALPFALRVFSYLYMLPVAFVIYPLLALCVYFIVKARGSRLSIETSSAQAATILKIVMPVGLVAFFLAGFNT